MVNETFVQKWKRRSISFSLYITFFVLVSALFPLLVIVCGAIDLIRKTNWATVRSAMFLWLYLFAETTAIFIAFLAWLFSGYWLGLGEKRFIDWTYKLQDNWGGILFHGACRIFRIRLDIDEPEGLDKGPLLLFVRHASLPDTSLPGALFVLRYGMRLRHIIKRELIWDPTLDIGVGRLRHLFVRRGGGDNTVELEKVKRLTEDIGPNDGVMIFPEGTRFSEKKRARIIEKLREKNDTYLLEKALSLKHVLPPRIGGSLAMLEANVKKAYAVFCAHAGFEKATKALNFLNGSLINKTVKVKMWKIPFDEIPKTREARIEWLFDNWAKVDRWIDKQLQMQEQLEEEPSPA